MVQVFGKPDCGGCTATKAALNKIQVPFAYRDVTTDPEAKAVVDGLGYSSMPVVVSDLGDWSGFRPDKIKSLVAV